MTNRDFDIVVIGAGMAGSTAAASLSADRRVALIETEDVVGYHTTGRSAAIWVQNYGPPDVRELTRRSRAFYENPPAGFAEVPLIRRRPVLLVATPNSCRTWKRRCSNGLGLRPHLGAGRRRRWFRHFGPVISAARRWRRMRSIWMSPRSSRGSCAMLRTNGGVLALRSQAGRIERRGGYWEIETASGEAVPRAGRGQCFRRLGRCGGGDRRRRAAGAAASPAHRGDHRSVAVRCVRLADDHRRQRRVVCPA